MIDFRKHTVSSETEKKIQACLVDFAYRQFHIAIISSLICASLLSLVLYQFVNTKILVRWYIIFIIISFLRLILAAFYLRDKNPSANLDAWKNLFTLGAFLAGLSWGFQGIFLFPSSSLVRLEALNLIIIAGLAAGGMISLSGILLAAVIFIVTALGPFIIQVLLQNTFMSLMLGTLMTVLLVYLVTITKKLYNITKKNFTLQFENEDLITHLDDLVKNLSLANKKLEHMATHDPLTKIDNRRLFYLNIVAAIKRAKRNNELLALLYIDLDGFKGVNDTFGHDVGDAVLLIVVQKLRENLRQTDIISRMGGDEFTVILEQIHTLEHVEMVAKKICPALSEPIKINDFEINSISASIGVSLYPIHGIDMETLIKNADSAMYFVKEHGRANYYLSQPMPQNFEI